MKARLNLTIDEHLLMEVKKLARKNDTSLSELVEQFFKKISATAKPKDILSILDKLESPHLHPGADLKELYYEENGKKYGF